VVSSLGRVVAFIGVALLLLNPTHLLNAALFFSPAGVFHTTIVETTSLGGVPAIWLKARWSRGAAMSHVIHTSTRFLGCGLLYLSLIFPLTQPLGAHRRRASVVIPMKGRIRRHALLGRKRHALVRADGTAVFRVGWIRRLVLGVGRLGRRDTGIVLMHEGSAVVPRRAAGAVWHV
jgi:hypothetical protein